MSPVTAGALYAKSMGNTIPKVVVTSSDQMTYMASISYKKMDEKSFRAANAQVKAGLAGESAPTLERAYECWVVASNGRYYTGEFTELKDDKTLMLKSPQGKDMKISMSQLTAGAQEYARLRAGGGSEEESVTTEEPEVEAWGSSKGGKSMRATFISLDGEMITLKKEGGKTITFKLSHLSEESQQRAKELAAK